jgi:hypothetical protein
MPALVNAEARLLLLSVAGDTIDLAAYSPDWHYPYLGNNKGVSLERIDFQRSGLDQTNWFSASAACGAATPGRPNSNRMDAGGGGDPPFAVLRGAAMGQSLQSQAVVAIGYRFEEPGWFAQISVYHSSGKPIRVIFPFNLLGKEGSILWDGLDEQGRMVTEGVYLVVAEYVHPTGRKGRWKSACGVRRDY